ncbi:hypothetical protein AB0M34_11460 [Nocardia sp. NPDC050193]
MTAARPVPARARYRVDRWDRRQVYCMPDREARRAAGFAAAGTVRQHGDDRVVVGIR